MKKLKMLTSILLAIVLCLSFVLPVTVNAQDTTYTITIKGEDGNVVNNDHTYDIYKIFDADLSTDNATLSNVKWSAALKGHLTGTDGIIAKLIAKDEAYADVGTTVDATKVVEVIAGTVKDSDKIIDFANVIGTFIKEYNKTAEGGSEIGSEGQATSPDYTLGGLTAGYYLAIDTNAPEDSAYSRYLAYVVKDTDMIIKSTKPTLEKDLVVNDEKVKENTVSKGDTVSYVITSSFPNMKEYTEYTYTVTDKLTKGLTFNENSVKVTIGGVEYTVENGKVVTGTEKPSTGFYVDVATAGGVESETDGVKQRTDTTITIDFVKFLELYTANVDAKKLDDTVESIVGKEIKIEYTATLNEYAETGKVSNRNTAELKYSNDPYSTSTTTTPTSDKTTTDTYTIDLELEKIEAGTSGESAVTLKGAQFNIYEYDEDAENHFGKKVNSELLETGEDGKVYVSKLGAGKYVLEEVKAPDGHNCLDYYPVIDITADLTPVDTTKEPVDWDVTVVEGTDSRGYVAVAKSVTDTEGIITVTVQNSSGLQLPSTGGVGTVIFTVVGILVMAAVVVIAVKSNKK